MALLYATYIYDDLGFRVDLSWHPIRLGRLVSTHAANCEFFV